jgi:hypothetical protein
MKTSVISSGWVHSNPVLINHAYGNGLGDFDLQGTFGIALPVADTNLVGRNYLWNNTFQYRLCRRSDTSGASSVSVMPFNDHIGLEPNVLS